MTAVLLLKALAPLEPAVGAGELVLSGAPPAHLDRLVMVLQTGVRAVLTNRPWYGTTDTGRGLGPLDDGALDPAKPLPWLTHRLCVAGDGRWDAVPPWWREEFAHLFGARPKTLPAKHVTGAKGCPHIPLDSPTPAGAA